jgi:uncharacterized protein YoxC
MEIWLYSIVVLAILVAIIFIIREMRKTGSGVVEAVKSLTTTTPTVTTPKNLADFLAEPANQEGGYTPWKATDE